MAHFNGIIGLDETLPVTQFHHDVYPAIDPKADFSNKTYRGKAVLITGASAGIGAAIALAYAKAGAAVAIVARKQEALEENKARILKEAPNAQVICFAADVKDWKRAEEVVKATITEFGRLDVLVANAGTMSTITESLTEKDPDLWWNTWEINVRGVFNFVHAAVPELQKSKGYAIVVSAGLAHLRFPGMSDYNISKFALGRLVEYIALEFPSVKAFALHPGVIHTNFVDAKLQERNNAGSFKFALGKVTLDPPELPAAVALYLTSGKADWLNGRYFASNWDIEEVERDWKAKIIEKNGLVTKLYIPGN